MTAGDVLWRLVCIKMFVFGWDADCGWREEMSRVTSTCCSRYHTSHSCCHARSWTIYQHLDMKSLNFCSNNLSISVHSAIGKCVAYILSNWACPFGLLVSHQFCCYVKQTCSVSQYVRNAFADLTVSPDMVINSASPLYQDFQWLLLELRCHPSSDP